MAPPPCAIDVSVRLAFVCANVLGARFDVGLLFFFAQSSTPTPIATSTIRRAAIAREYSIVVDMPPRPVDELAELDELDAAPAAPDEPEAEVDTADSLSRSSRQNFPYSRVVRRWASRESSEPPPLASLTWLSNLCALTKYYFR